jgi:hypothetical protein
LLDGPLGLKFAKEFGGISCCGLQGLHGSEAGLDEKGEFFVEGEPGKTSGAVVSVPAMRCTPAKCILPTMCMDFSSRAVRKANSRGVTDFIWA